jgi:hypothetical protein
MNDLTVYQSLRGQMKTGDLVEWRADSLLGEAIRLKTGYDVNHSGIVVVLDSPYSGLQRVFTFEALGDGIDVTFMSVKLRDWKGKAYWYALKEEFWNQILSIEEKAFSYIGVPYDYAGLVEQLVGRVQVGDHKLFCSEYVYICNGGTGTAPVPGELPLVMQRWLERKELL